MLAFFDPASREVVHLVTDHSDEYLNWALNPATTHAYPYVLINDRMPMEHIEILPDHSVRRRVPMLVSGPPQVFAGDRFQIVGVPNSARVFIDSAEIGEMDASGVLDLTLETPARYVITLDCSGFIRKELHVEVLP